MDLQEYLIYKKLAGGGGGSSITVEPLQVTENGVYTAQSGKAYSPVTVDVSTDFDMTVTANQVKLLIDITDNNLLTVNVGYCQSVSEGVEVDFGEGEVQKSTNTGATFPSNYAYVTHTYSTQGQKLITLTCKSGTLKLLGGGSAGLGSAILVYDTTVNVENNYYGALAESYHTLVKEIAIGDNIICTKDCLSRLPFLTKTNKYEYDGNALTLIDNIGIKKITISSNVTSIGSYFLSSIKGVKTIELSEGLTEIASSAFVADFALSNINIPSTVTSIGANAFSSCYGVVVDFTAISLVEGVLPIAFGTNIFSGTNASFCKLIFATQEIAEVAKQTTNLTVYASLIHYVGEGE